MTQEMIVWNGDNLKEVIEFVGLSPRFSEWFNSWDEYEEYVHSHGDVLKLFEGDSNEHYEVYVGCTIMRLPHIEKNIPITEGKCNLIKSKKNKTREEPVSNDLEEAAQNWWEKTRLKSDLSGTPINAFKAGAQWKNGKFIEKACEFFENHLCCYIKAQDFTIEHSRLEQDFKKFMEE